MTDAPFTETHRLILQALEDASDGSAILPSERAAVRAALAEIDRLRASLQAPTIETLRAYKEQLKNKRTWFDESEENR